MGEAVLQTDISQQYRRCFLSDTRDAFQQFPAVFHIRIIVCQVFYLLLKTLQLCFKPQKVSINARSLDFPRRFSAIQFLRVHICQRMVADYQGTQRAFKRVRRFPGCRALLTTELCQHARIHGISLVTQSFTLSESFTQRRIND
ncbi:Uncharacterised protein [Escherichia coli]|nr:hypothetical protein HmCmsJML003_04220 [Escherichia coli]GCS80167.1 hypothetical protein HmCmsJML018_04415 [Escherichia coli]GDK35559.1 hypothetical protein BvCmsKSP054_05269 [Escherichia coli]GDK51577.1 hypothetical protein BvCmsKSP018_05097 [Escherichia coli]SQK49670.1 Uncharacterised protein [Escherichia coli]